MNGMRFDRKIPALIVLGLMLQLLFAFNAFSAADPGYIDYLKAFESMKGVGCVRGYADGAPHLDDALTRAQAATFLVSCMGGQGMLNGEQVSGPPDFPDAKNHWANASIAAAKRMGLVDGMPDGKFHPDDKVTYAQLFQMLDNAVGVQPDATLGWPDSAIKAAVDAGIISTDANASYLKYVNKNASRGAAFFYTNSAFTNVTLADGKNAYQTYLDKPSLTVETPPTDSKQLEVTLKGTAKRATSVSIDGTAVKLNADFTWSGTVSLDCGDNTFKIVAVDSEGNNVSKDVKIKRIADTGSVTQDIYGCPAQ